MARRGAVLALFGLLAGCGRTPPKKALTGRELYLANGCAACHGMSGDGRGMADRALDPPPTDFRDLTKYRHGHDKDSMIRAIRDGVVDEESQMPAFHNLSAVELGVLADYLSSLQPAAKRRVLRGAPITASGAWARAAPPSATVGAAYMTIRNDSAEAAHLESVRTAAARSAEIHRMSQVDGMMRMEPVKELEIPAHGRAVLEPGGFHLMLIGLKRPLRAGSRVKLTLRFRGGRVLTVVAPVRAGEMKMRGMMH